MTAEDAPYTLLEAVVRDLRAAAFDGAMDVALTLPVNSETRRQAVRAANRAFEMDVDEQARKLVAYLNEHFGASLDPDAPRLNDERVQKGEQS